MSHRGPDDHRLYFGQGVALGARRLSIIDPSTGGQPVSNEDGTVTVVLNGEIYNYRELRRDLERRGHQLRTDGDTETLAHLYEELGPDLVQELRGMFAIAIWDARRHRLIIARDRLGIKPLFYAPLDRGFAFASEMKALLQAPGIDRRPSWPALGHVLSFMVPPATHSMVRGIEKLPPAHRAEVTAAGHRVTRYWDLQFTPDRRASRADLTAQLRATFDDALDLHLRSDVPVGAFLSGGVDSTAVVAAMARRAPGRVQAFTVGFNDPRFDERPYARAAARACGVDLHELVIDDSVDEVLESVIWHLDEPFGDSSAIPTYMVSKLAARHVKVVLTGDGGDELFAGYDKYAVERRERRYDRIPRLLRHALAAVGDRLPPGTRGREFLRHLDYDGAARYLHASMLFDPAEQQRLLRPEALAMVSASDPTSEALRDLTVRGDHWLTALQRCDLSGYLPLDILTKVDRMTMAHSIEARPVLLDHRLVELAATIPSSLQLRGGTRKYLFKEAVRDLVPRSILERRKQGFAAPLAHWFRGAWLDLARDVLLSRRARERGWIDPRYVEHLLQLHAAGRNLDLKLWTLVSLECWCRMFLDTPVRPERLPTFVRRHDPVGVMASQVAG